MPVQRLREFLDRNQVRYVVIHHSPAYTAQEIAASAHIRGQFVAKTVIVKLVGGLAMVVTPAHRELDFEKVRAVTGDMSACLATENEFREKFPGCELGAMPPFGNLYGLDVYADESLTRDPEIAFNAGSHRELIRLAYKDFERLVKPKVAKLA